MESLFGVGLMHSSKFACISMPGAFVEDNVPVSSQKPEPIGPIFCSVPGCSVNLSEGIYYYRRHRTCETHMKAKVVSINGQDSRFCQQCGRFHPLSDFKGDRKSCIAALKAHNDRRRSMTQDPAVMVGERRPRGGWSGSNSASSVHCQQQQKALDPMPRLKPPTAAAGGAASRVSRRQPAHRSSSFRSAGDLRQQQLKLDAAAADRATRSDGDQHDLLRRSPSGSLQSSEEPDSLRAPQQQQQGGNSSLLSAVQEAPATQSSSQAAAAAAASTYGMLPFGQQQAMCGVMDSGMQHTAAMQPTHYRLGGGSDGVIAGDGPQAQTGRSRLGLIVSQGPAALSIPTGMFPEGPSTQQVGGLYSLPGDTNQQQPLQQHWQGLPMPMQRAGMDISPMPAGAGQAGTLAEWMTQHSHQSVDQLQYFGGSLLVGDAVSDPSCMLQESAHGLQPQQQQARPMLQQPLSDTPVRPAGSQVLQPGLELQHSGLAGHGPLGGPTPPSRLHEQHARVQQDQSWLDLLLTESDTEGSAMPGTLADADQAAAAAGASTSAMQGALNRSCAVASSAAQDASLGAELVPGLCDQADPLDDALDMLDVLLSKDPDWQFVQASSAANASLAAAPTTAMHSTPSSSNALLHNPSSKLSDLSGSSRGVSAEAVTPVTQIAALLDPAAVTATQHAAGAASSSQLAGMTGQQPALSATTGRAQQAGSSTLAKGPTSRPAMGQSETGWNLPHDPTANTQLGTLAMRMPALPDQGIGSMQANLNNSMQGAAVPPAYGAGVATARPTMQQLQPRQQQQLQLQPQQRGQQLQHQLLRLSIKLHGVTPDQLPSSTVQAMERLLAQFAGDMEAVMLQPAFRQGCVQMEFDILVRPQLPLQEYAGCGAEASPAGAGAGKTDEAWSAVAAGLSCSQATAAAEAQLRDAFPFAVLLQTLCDLPVVGSGTGDERAGASAGAGADSTGAAAAAGRGGGGGAGTVGACVRSVCAQLGTGLGMWCADRGVVQDWTTDSAAQPGNPSSNSSDVAAWRPQVLVAGPLVRAAPAQERHAGPVDKQQLLLLDVALQPDSCISDYSDTTAEDGEDDMADCSDSSSNQSHDSDSDDSGALLWCTQRGAFLPLAVGSSPATESADSGPADGVRVGMIAPEPGLLLLQAEQLFSSITCSRPKQQQSGETQSQGSDSLPVMSPVVPVVVCPSADMAGEVEALLTGQVDSTLAGQMLQQLGLVLDYWTMHQHHQRQEVAAEDLGARQQWRRKLMRKVHYLRAIRDACHNWLLVAAVHSMPVTTDCVQHVLQSLPDGQGTQPATDACMAEPGAGRDHAQPADAAASGSRCGGQLSPTTLEKDPAHAASAPAGLSVSDWHYEDVSCGRSSSAVDSSQDLPSSSKVSNIGQHSSPGATRQQPATARWQLQIQALLAVLLLLLVYKLATGSRPGLAGVQGLLLRLLLAWTKFVQVAFGPLLVFGVGFASALWVVTREVAEQQRAALQQAVPSAVPSPKGLSSNAHTSKQGLEDTRHGLCVGPASE